ncbi:hypothetical protein Pr1d_37200 [Bythopirellula goksoeyrii]|uniref:Uncharacterized protein n=1 Tax=Bythopirellula goksoeyrii TaxID=1400387 RepID=A0A5B9QHF9_9BACT|nr:hypothetical protein Pr1d_37200 [Bythopirellula goksoeyrii]
MNWYLRDCLFWQWMFHKAWTKRKIISQRDTLLGKNEKDWLVSQDRADSFSLKPKQWLGGNLSTIPGFFLGRWLRGIRL